jgi:hypothetical protein
MSVLERTLRTSGLGAVFGRFQIVLGWLGDDFVLDATGPRRSELEGYAFIRSLSEV